MAQLAAVLQDTIQANQRPVVVATLAWAPELLKGLLEGLAESDQGAFLRLRDLVRDPPEIELVLANITTPAAWLADARSEVWVALALMAAQKGEWLPASLAWERAAVRISDDYAAAGSFVSAAASANAGGDFDRRAEMLTRAGERYPRHPRLILKVTRDLPPRAQLDALAHVETREPVDLALVSAQQALTCLLLPDLDEAERLAEKASQAMPGNLGVRTVLVNIEIQRARLNVSQASATLRSTDTPSCRPIGSRRSSSEIDAPARNRTRA